MRRVIVLKPLQETHIFAREPCAHADEVSRPSEMVKQAAKPITICRPAARPAFFTQPLTPTTSATLAVLRHMEMPSPLGSWADRQIMHEVVGMGPKVGPDLSNVLPKVPGQELSSQQHLHAHNDRLAEPAVGNPDAAWRQRFALKWHREQSRPCKICNDDMCDDPWHAALHVLQAANAHPYLQTPLPDHDCYSPGSAPAPLLGCDDDAENVLEEREIVVSASEAAITRSSLKDALSEAANKTRQLFKHQVPTP